MDNPKLIALHKICEQNRKIRKKGYDVELYDIADLLAYNVIFNEKYNKMSPLVGNALPTMAISTISCDKNGNPKRVKWRITDLDNTYPHEWTKNDCYEPVLSMIELRYLEYLALNHKRPLQNRDIKQYLCKAIIHPKENTHLVHHQVLLTIRPTHNVS